MRTDTVQRVARPLTALLALLLILGGLLPNPTVSAQTQQADPNLTVTVQPNLPRITPGAKLVYEIRVNNPQSRTLDRVEIQLPYNAAQLTPIDSAFPKAGDWVQSIKDGKLTVALLSVKAGETRTAKIVYQSNAALTAGTELKIYGNYFWNVGANRSRGTSATERVRVVVPARQPETRVAPAQARAGSAFQFAANGFGPRERVATWLNLPGGGVQGVDLRGATNDNGEVWVGLSSAGLQAGTYSLVLYGTDSGQTAVVPFTVQP